MNYLVRGIKYKTLAKELGRDSCGDIPRKEICFGCKCELVDICHLGEEKPDKFSCYTCFGKMFIQFDNKITETNKLIFEKCNHVWGATFGECGLIVLWYCTKCRIFESREGVRYNG